jgi:anti-sigma regulatory factor (Ser/Thr protein kinase)
MENPENMPYIVHREFEIVSDFAELTRVRSGIRAACQHTPPLALSEDGVDQLELAVNEAVGNIIAHAHRGRYTQTIHIVAKVYADRVVVRLSYSGDPFDPAMVPPPSFDGSRDHGFGLYIIAHSVDEVYYTRDAQGRNVMCLIKRRGDLYAEG